MYFQMGTLSKSQMHLLTRGIMIDVRGMEDKLLPDDGDLYPRVFQNCSPAAAVV